MATLDLDKIIYSLKNFGNLYQFKNSDLEYLIKNDIIPFGENVDSVFCVFLNYDNNLVQNVEFLFDKACKIYTLSNEDFFILKKEFLNKMSDNNQKKGIEIFKLDSEEDESNLRVINYLNKLIENAIVRNATDIHIEPFKNEIRVRYRIDGVLETVDRIDKIYQSIIITRIKILANLDLTEKRLPLDGRITFLYQNRDIDLRISTVPTIYGEKIAIRILDSDFKFTELKSLGFRDEDLLILERELNNLSGLILICGPTNSGKTTTIYSILNKINSEKINITTIEDPVEYKIDGINQIQVNYKAGLEFLNTLNFLLRQDPEVLVIGEVREEKTAQTLMRASITGHMSISSIHTRDCISTIDRLRDMGSENYLISSGLKLIISQRLVRKLCPHCKKSREIDIDIFPNLKQVYYPDGCSYCNKGYKGRTALFEVLEIDNNIRRLINENKSYDEIYDEAVKNGFKDLKKVYEEALELGITSIEEILKII